MYTNGSGKRSEHIFHLQALLQPGVELGCGKPWHLPGHLQKGCRVWTYPGEELYWQYISIRSAAGGFPPYNQGVYFLPADGPTCLP